jgi:hypothetical protein
MAGHAEYVMRVFDPGAGVDAPFVEAALLNTPNVELLRGSPAAKAGLVEWVAQNLREIDGGTAELPQALSAKVAVSVTPRGLSRRANRPFLQVLSERDLSGLELTGLKVAKSPAALLRRLDESSCVGCHQSRTIAGFHLLGEDPQGVGVGNELGISVSVHLASEAERRAKLQRALAGGKIVDWVRPFAERAPNDTGGYGAHCGLGDSGFADWTCAPGLHCDRYDAPDDDVDVGICLPDQPEVGDPCEVGEMRAHAHPHRDRVLGAKKRACRAGSVCNTNAVGFPGGMCTETCDDLSEHGDCGVIAQLSPFNACLARKEPFTTCLAEHVAPAGLRACGTEAPCRDDYICTLGPKRTGVCIPPYFLFQLRVDGHQ